MYSSPKLGEVPVRAVGYITNLQYTPKLYYSVKNNSIKFCYSAVVRLRLLFNVIVCHLMANYSSNALNALNASNIALL